MPDPERQYKAIPSRDFRWDFAWPDYRLLLEVDGAEWVTGRHNRGVGMAQDSEKQCLAAIHGWFTMRVTGSLVRNSQAVAWVVLYMAGHGLDGPRCPRCHRVTGSNPNATSPADHYYCEECRMTVSEP